jgi:hypothetical protein
MFCRGKVFCLCADAPTVDGAVTELQRVPITWTTTA